jgi:hypothetical protein
LQVFGGLQGKGLTLAEAIDVEIMGTNAPAR